MIDVEKVLQDRQRYIIQKPENCRHLADYDYLLKSMAEGLPQSTRKNYANNVKIIGNIKRDPKKTANQKTNQIMTILLLGMVEEEV